MSDISHRQMNFQEVMDNPWAWLSAVFTVLGLIAFYTFTIQPEMPDLWQKWASDWMANSGFLFAGIKLWLFVTAGLFFLALMSFCLGVYRIRKRSKRTLDEIFRSKWYLPAGFFGGLAVLTFSTLFLTLEPWLYIAELVYPHIDAPDNWAVGLTYCLHTPCILSLICSFFMLCGFYSEWKQKQKRKQAELRSRSWP